MRTWRFMRVRPGRFLVVLLTLVVFVALVIIDAERTFTNIPGTSLSGMVSFGFSIFVALFFLAIGTLVWLYARERWVALLLFSLSFSMMLAFTLQTGAVAGDTVLIIIGDSGAALAPTILATLLLFFPTNRYITSHEHTGQAGAISHTLPRFKWLRGYLLLLWGLCFLSVAQTIFFTATNLPALSFLIIITYVSNLIALTGTIVTIIITYRRKSTPRERQQLRFFVIGVIAATAPLLVLTVLPGLLASAGVPATPYIVDGQISSTPVVLLPAAFGYSILRYQILVFDRYIERAVSWTMGVIFLAILGYGVGVIANILFPSSPRLYNGVLISSLVLLAPVAWWLAHRLTARLFFRDMQHYRRLIEKPGALVRETPGVDEAAELLTLAAVDAFMTSEVCLFVADKNSGYFQLAPPLSEENPHDMARQHLAQRLMAEIERAGAGAQHSKELSFQGAGRLKAGHLLLRNVDKASRPLFLSEAVKPEDQQPRGLARFISTSEVVNDPLLVAVRVQGEMIGLLALGERGDHGEYAGPDFDIIELLLARYAPLLENARLYEQATRDLREAYERQKKLDRLKDQFIITASHELRTPLTAVQGYIDLLHNYGERLTPEQRADFVAKAGRGCDELTLMLNNIMDASRVQGEDEVVELSPLKLAEPVAQVLEMMEGIIRRKNRRVSVDIAPEMIVQADEQRLKQIIMNVVGNALKYSPPGSALEISACAGEQAAGTADAQDATDSLCMLRIRDYGPGVPRAEQEHLFERFIRLERDMNSPVRGAGLGLFICKQLTRAMGGNIWVESTGIAGEGSTFVVALKQFHLAQMPVP
jgi:signal transduction histidine kinase